MNAVAEPEISLYDIWKIIRRGWFTSIVATIVGASLGYFAGLVIPHSYQTQVVFADVSGSAAPDLSGAGLLGALALGGVGGSSGGASTQGQLAPLTILRSRTFAEAFIARHDLMPYLFPRNWDAEQSEWKGTPPQPRHGAFELNRKVALGPARTVPGALALQVTWPTADGSALVANGLIEMLNEVARDRDIRSAERSIEYLNRKIATTDIVELQRSLFNLLEAEQKTLMMANARESYAYEIIDEALVPEWYSVPNKRQLIIAGFVGGMGIGFAIVFIVALFRSWRKD